MLKILIALVVSVSVFSCFGENSSNVADGDVLIDGDSDKDDSQTTDGDSTQIDSDLESEFDWAEDDISCLGSCLNSVPDICMNGQLCVCNHDSGQLEEHSCDDVCEEAGLGASTGCGYNTNLGVYNCTCEIPVKQCDADLIIDQLPFEDSNTTKDKENNFGLLSSCFEWGVIGPDVIYSIRLDKGNSIEATVQVMFGSEYDPSLIVAKSCSNSSTCLRGSDSHWSNESEKVTFTADENGVYFIVVDSGYNPNVVESSGSYVLNVTGTMYNTVDGDEDTVVDGDTIPDGDGEFDELDGELDSDENINDGDLDYENEDADEYELENPEADGESVVEQETESL